MAINIKHNDLVDARWLSQCLRFKYELLYVFVVLFSGIFSNPMSVFIISLFPIVFLFKITKSNFPFVLPIVFTLNLGVVMCSGVLLAMMRIPLTVTSLLVFNFFATISAYFWTRRLSFKKIVVEKLDPMAVFCIYIVFFVALYALVASVVGSSAPILHDPLAHAFWAKQISDTHTINYFYSPGLHILIMVISKAFGTSFAVSTLYVTNFLSSLAILTFGAVAYLVTKSRVFAAVSALLIFVFPFPSELYYVGGKNAFVAAIAFVPLVFYFLSLLIKAPSVRNCLLFTLSLSTIFIIHYPTGGQVAIFSFAMMAIVSIYKVGTPKIALNILKYAALAGIILMLVGASWFAFTNEARIDSKSNQVLRTSTSSNSSEVITNDGGIHLRSSLNLTYRQFRGLSDSYSVVYFPLGMATIVALAAIYRRSIYLAIPILAFTVFSCSFFINLFNLDSLKTVRDSGAMMMFLIFALGIGGIAAFLADHATIGKIKGTLIVFILAVFLFQSGIQQHNKFSKNTLAFEMVDQRDVAAFKWIKLNLDPHALFLNNAIRTEAKNEIVLPTDGGSWIPVYLNNSITMPFQDGLFSKENTHDNYNLYEGLSTDSKASFCAFVDVGVQYYYNDLKTPYIAAVNVVKSSPSNGLSLVYKNSGVEIYRISNSKKICSSK